MKYCTVYLASALGKDISFAETAYGFGKELAQKQIGIVYGGANVGCMGKLADGCLSSKGSVVGVFPDDGILPLEHQHEGLTELVLVNGMQERKRVLLERGDAIVALPGGPGTFEELCEVISWKRLHHHRKPIYLLNTNGYYLPFKAMFEKAQENEFMKDPMELFELIDTHQEIVNRLVKDFGIPT